MAQSDRANLIGSSAIKVPVKAATTAAITLSGAQTIDGISCVAGDRVLVKNQSDAKTNGIYKVDTGAWSRATDFDGTYDVVKGTLVAVVSGTVNGPSFWQVTSENPITIGTTDIDFALRVNALSGVSALMQALLDDTTVGAAQTTLGISAFIQTLLVAADAAAARTTLGGVPTLTGAETLTNKTLTAPAISQVVFPAAQVPSADANTLDDYEEGTWTPSLGGNATYSFQTGHYTKIGRMVFITCDFQVLLIGTGSTTVISGLPFVVGTQSAGCIGSFGGAATNVVSAYPNLVVGGSLIQILSQTVAASNNAANAFFGNGTSIQFSAIYRV